MRRGCDAAGGRLGGRKSGISMAARLASAEIVEGVTDTAPVFGAVNIVVSLTFPNFIGDYGVDFPLVLDEEAPCLTPDFILAHGTLVFEFGARRFPD